MTRRTLIALVLAAVAVVGLLGWRFLRPSGDRPPIAGDGAPALAVAEDEWPRFRGPTGLGVAKGKAPVEWSADKNLRWKTPLPGPGSSSPIVWGGRVWVTCFSGHDGGTLRRHLVCVNREDGKVRWTKTVDAALPEDHYGGFLAEHGYASNTPCTDGERVYAFFGKTGVIAYTVDGEEVWRADVGRQSSGRRWGSAASPILYGDLLIVNASEEGRAVFAFDRKTGKEVWKAPARSTELSFNTPVLVPVAGGKVEMVLTVPGQMWGMDPLTGGLLWHAATGLDGNVSPSVVAADGVVYATGGYSPTRTVAVKAGGRGAVTPEWTVNDAAYVPSPVVHDGHLYLVGHEGNAFCLDAKTGEQKGRRRVGGGAKVYASPVLADGRLYAVTRRAGTFVFEAAPGMKQIAVNKFAGDESDFNGSPAVNKGEMFLRSDRFLYCVGEKKE